jgi:hypothetical protein
MIRRNGTKFSLSGSLAPGICTTLQLLDYMTSYPGRQFPSTESYSLQFEAFRSATTRSVNEALYRNTSVPYCARQEPTIPERNMTEKVV